MRCLVLQFSDMLLQLFFILLVVVLQISLTLHVLSERLSCSLHFFLFSSCHFQLVSQMIYVLLQSLYFVNIALLSVLHFDQVNVHASSFSFEFLHLFVVEFVFAADSFHVLHQPLILLSKLSVLLKDIFFL